MNSTLENNWGKGTDPVTSQTARTQHFLITNPPTSPSPLPEMSTTVISPRDTQFTYETKLTLKSPSLPNGRSDDHMPFFDEKIVNLRMLSASRSTELVNSVLQAENSLAPVAMKTRFEPLRILAPPAWGNPAGQIGESTKKQQQDDNAATVAGQPTAKKNFGSDFSKMYVRTGTLPQLNVRNIENPLEGYPKLQRLQYLKQQHNHEHSREYIGIRCSTTEIPSFVDSIASQNVQFDVAMVHGCIEPFPLAQLEELNLEKLMPRPSLLFIWVPMSHIADGRRLMEKWGFRRAEDITFMVSSHDSAYAPPGLVPPGNQRTGSAHKAFTTSTWHCLMGLKGTLRRSIDGSLINCNVDTDVIIEKEGQRRCVVPEQIYSLIENFTSMSRRLHIVPTATTEKLPVRPRKGWVIVSPDAFSAGTLSPSQFQRRQLLPFNQEVDGLRPRTPPPKGSNKF